MLLFEEGVLEVLLYLLDAMERVDFSVVDPDDCVGFDHAQTVHNHDSDSRLISPLELHLVLVAQHKLLPHLHHLHRYIKVPPLHFFNILHFHSCQLVSALCLLLGLMGSVGLPSVLPLDGLLTVLEVDRLLTVLEAGGLLTVLEVSKTLGDLFGKFQFLFLH